MLQSVLIPKTFSYPGAILWLQEHHYSHHKVDITDDFYRFRQHDPLPGAHYYTITLPNHVELIYYTI